MAKNVLLVFPRVTVRKTAEKTFFPPLNLLFLTSVLEKAGFDVNIVDQRLKENYKEIIKEHLNEDTAFVGITAMTGNQILQGLDIAQLVRDVSPELPLVWGGVHPTLLPLQTMKDPLVDIIVKGEGEETIVELAEVLSERKNLKGVRGILYKEDGKVVENMPRPWIDMTTLPMPAWEKIHQDMGSYIYEDKVRLHTSRGCPHKCKFCYNKGYNAGHWSAKNAKQICDEIEYIIDKYDVHMFHFVDDNFMTNRKRVMNFCEELHKRKIKISWGFSIRIDYIKEKTMKILADSGVNEFFLGVESGSQRILDMIDKHITVEKIISANKILGKLGIKARYSFMSGFPFELLSDLENTVKTAVQIRDENQETDFNLCNYTPYPGTDLYDIVNEKFSFPEPESFREWGKCTWDESMSFKRGSKYKFENIHLMWTLHFSDALKLPSYVRPIQKWASFRIRKGFLTFTPEFSLLKLLGKIKSPF